ncbi:hypothetical protein ACRAWD_11445 [Caulobacter segnis]
MLDGVLRFDRRVDVGSLRRVEDDKRDNPAVPDANRADGAVGDYGGH